MKKIKGDDPTPRQFVEALLPDHYEVKETISGCIRCNSKTGIRDADKWNDFMKAVKNFFGQSFQEVYHTTCTYHVVFTVYYSYLLFNSSTFHEKEPRQ